MMKKGNPPLSPAVKAFGVMAIIILIGIAALLFLCSRDLKSLSGEAVPRWVFAIASAAAAGVLLFSSACVLLALSYAGMVREQKAYAIESEILKSIELCEAILGGIINIRRSGKYSAELSLYNALVANDPGALAGDTGKLFESNMLRALALLVDVEERVNELQKIGKDPSSIAGYHYCRHLLKVMKSWIAGQRGNCVLDTYESFRDIQEYFESGQ